jgi:hypothetical protein
LSEEEIRRSQERDSSRPAKIIAWVFLGLGAWLCWFGAGFLPLALKSESWPAVQAQIVSSRLRTSLEGDANVRVYHPEYTYRYQVEGNEYTASMYRLGETAAKHNNRKDAEAARIPSGSSISVYYDPDDPAQAVMVTGAGIGAYVPLMMGLFFGACGLLGFKLSSRKSQLSGPIS